MTDYVSVKLDGEVTQLGLVDTRNTTEGSDRTRTACSLGSCM